MVKIIGIAGKMKSGKDTVAQMLLDIFPKYELIKFATPVKQIASLITGIPIEKFEDQEFKDRWLGQDWEDHNLNFEEPYTVRKLLQRIGTEAGRNTLHPDVWVNAIFSKFTNESKWIISDVRFVNELVAIKSKGGIVIKIERDNIDMANQHESEKALDSINDKMYYKIINNNGTIEELHKKVVELSTDIALNRSLYPI